METVDRWLKSLRLHKYTHLFSSMTYEEMLNIQEQFLIDMDVTKGARNKILVSIKKLNLRQDRLVYMIDDLNQGNISMKEALTVLKEMLITPIPRPYDHAPSPAISLTESLPSVSSGISVGSSISHDNNSTDSSTGPPTRGTATKMTSAASIYYTDPHDLTHLFVDTFEKVAQRLIESAGFEDNACHGILAAIVDECLKHNSFTDEQKARVACFNQPILREQRVRRVTAREQKAKVARYRQLIMREQNARGLLKKQFYQAAESEDRQPYPFREYSLLGPGLTFELPCLRAKAEANKKHTVD
jgi:hypothetical protein